MTNNLCATTILYNPDDIVFENIKTYVPYVEELYLIDNSEHINHNLIKELLFNYKNILYINNKENLGIAKALNIACDLAIDRKKKWILTMDQDSSFDNFNNYLNCFFRLADKKKISLICANHLSNNTYNKCEMSIEEFVITSSCLLNLEHFNKIGKFNEDLFIDEVDHDYCARSNKLNFKIIQFKHISFGHTIGYNNNHTSQHNYIRAYYIVRNSLYMASKYSKIYYQYSYKYIFYTKIYKKLFRVLKREDQKLKKIYYILLAIVDFLRGKYGKKS